VLHRYVCQDGNIETRDPYPPPAKSGDPPAAGEMPSGFRTGICLDREAEALFSLTILAKGDTKSFAWGDATTDKGQGGAITRIATSHIATGTDAPPRSAACGKRPYDVVKGRNGLLYVSDWADRKVLVVDPDTLRTLTKIPVGEHPKQLAPHPRDDRLFVACASTNSVDVIDTKAGTVQETIFTALFPQAPEGSTPDALAITPDGETLLVANADNNCVAVVDIESARRSQVKGFIPTGWYPTALATTPDGKQILVGVGKGNQTRPNPPAKEALDAAGKPAQAGGYRNLPFPYIGTTLSGTLSIVEMPDQTQLQEFTN
ncbi:MAG: YncE family protein, partial [Terriglobales bacterium]